MTTIWKYPLPGVASSFSLSLPKGARILSAQVQGDRRQLWALCSDSALPESRQFTIVGTGWDIDPSADLTPVYVATWQEGPYVWHLFELRPALLGALMEFFR